MHKSVICLKLRNCCEFMQILYLHLHCICVCGEGEGVGERSPSKNGLATEKVILYYERIAHFAVS